MLGWKSIRSVRESATIFRISNKNLCSHASQDETGEISWGRTSRGKKMVAAATALASQRAIGEIKRLIPEFLNPQRTGLLGMQRRSNKIITLGQ